MYILEGKVLIQFSCNFVRMIILIKSRSSSKLGHVGSKTRSPNLRKTLCTVVGTVLIQSSLNFVRMFIFIKSTSRWKLGHVGSKTRSQGQIIEKPFIHSRGYNFDLKFMKLCQNNPHKILVKFETGLCCIKS